MKKSIWQDPSTTEIIVESVDSCQYVDQPSGRIEKFLLQNSPVNNELARNENLSFLLHETSDAPPISECVTEVIVRSKSKAAAQVVTYVAFKYDDGTDLDSIAGKDKTRITAYDRRIYNAVSTLYINNGAAMTLSEIFCVMTGYAKKNPSKKQLESIEHSLEKLSYINVYINVENEIKNKMIDKRQMIALGALSDQQDEIIMKSQLTKLLKFDLYSTVSKNGKIFKFIRLNSEPILLTYNRVKGTLISIPMEYVGISGKSATDKTIAFQDYLLMRIVGYKNGKLREHKIRYDTLYRDSGQEKPLEGKAFIRDRETIKAMMEDWKEKGLIAGYEEEKEGKSYVSISFSIKEEKKLEGKE